MNEPLTPIARRANPGDLPSLLTVPEACEVLRISRWSLYQLINKGRLKTIRIDRRRLIAATDLAVLIEKLRIEGGGDGR